MTADAVLVNPLDHTHIRRKLGLKAPPLNLMYLGGYLRERGYQVKILDDNVLELGPEAVARKVAAEGPLLVGLTAATATVNSARSYIDAVKGAVPEATTVLGGPHVTFMPLEAFHRCRGLDVAVLGEGEETLAETADRLENGGGLSEVRGIAYREGGQIKANQARPLIEDLDSLPLPARDLVDYRLYRDPVKKRPIGSMITSRGCVHNCSYCASSRLMGRRFRWRSPASIADEMEVLVGDYEVKDIEFLDDNFMLHRKRADAVAQEIERRGIDAHFVASSRVDTVDRAVLSDLVDVGLSSLYLGLESGCQRVLDLMGKGITPEQGRDAVRTAKECGLNVLGSFILGYPGETLEEMDETIAYSIRTGVDYAQYSILTPYPGTPIHEQLRRDGAIGDDYDRYTVVDPVIDYEKFGLSSKQVNGKLNKAYLMFYGRPGYLLKHPGVIKMIPRALLGRVG